MFLGIHGLGHPVGIEKKHLPRMQGHGKGTIGHLFHGPGHGSAHPLLKKGLPGRFDQGRIVAGIGVGQTTGLYIENSHQQGNEHAVGIVPAQDIIDFKYNLIHFLGGLGTGFDQCPGDGHEQGRRYPLVRYITNGKAQVIVVQEKKVIKIPAHLPGRLKQCMEVKLRAFRVGRKNLGQNTQLDIPGHIELPFNALLGSGGGDETVDVFLKFLKHIEKRGCQIPHFVLSLRVKALFQVQSEV